MMVLAAEALVRRELIRFWREKARVAGFVAAPFLFWIVVSAGFNDFQRFFAGSIALSLMFSAVFSNMTLIDDRKEGFLAGMLVSPAPRSAIVFGKAGGSALLAWLQSLIFLCCLPLAGMHPDFFAFLAAAGVLALISALFTLLGFVCAWKMPSTQAFHGIINLILMPMWMLSGSLFPYEKAHFTMQWLMRVNPMTYAMSLLNQCIQGQGTFDPLVSLAVVLAWTAVLFFLSLFLVRNHGTRTA